MALTKVIGAGLGTVTSADLDGAVTVNESGASVDFRVESDGDANALVVDASANRVGIGESAPASKLEITAGGNSHGLLRLNESDASNLSGYMQFDSNGTNKANVQNANNAGIHLCVGTGGSVVFTALGYTAANALDDYEEGEWTPQYEPASGSFGGSYLTQKGRYTKVGRVVTVEFQLVANFSNNTQSGTVKVIGLPFTVSAHSSGGSFHGLNIAQSTRFTGDPPRGGQIQENSTKIFLWKTVEATGGGSDVASLTTSNFILTGGNPNNLVASITYFAS